MMSESSSKDNILTFFDLSRELRDQIYEFTIGKETNFIVVDTPPRNNQLFDSEEDEGDESTWITDNLDGLDLDEGGLPADRGCVSYESNPFPPISLFLLNKHIHTEAKEVLMRTRAKMASLLKPYTYRHHNTVLRREYPALPPKDHELRELLRSSNFILRDPDVDLAIRFLDLGIKFRHTLHSLVITESILRGGVNNPRIQRAWTPASRSSGRLSRFMETLQTHPTIKEIAVFIPGVGSDETEDYCKQAPLEAIGLLRSNNLCTVRLFSRDVLDQGEDIIAMNPSILTDVFRDLVFLEMRDNDGDRSVNDVLSRKVTIPRNIVIERAQKHEARRYEGAGTMFIMEKRTCDEVKVTKRGYYI